MGHGIARGLLVGGLVGGMVGVLGVLGVAHCTEAPFPVFLTPHFDYADFMRFEAPAPPKTGIYQSNGYFALIERGFGGQRVNVPAATGDAPDVHSDVMSAVEIGSPQLRSASGVWYDFAKAPGQRRVEYFADRTVYHVEFEGGPAGTLTVYPVYGLAGAVWRLRVTRASGPIHVRLDVQEGGFAHLAGGGGGSLSYGPAQWPYRLMVSAGTSRRRVGSSGLEWDVVSGGEVAAVLAFGKDSAEALGVLSRLEASRDLWQRDTHRAWNAYQKWLGDSYDAVFDPGKPTRVWRNGVELISLAPDRIWRARKVGGGVRFEAGAS